MELTLGEIEMLNDIAKRNNVSVVDVISFFAYCALHDLEKFDWSLMRKLSKTKIETSSSWRAKFNE
ncbi:MAG: hypothetical protein KGI25_10090 [Thaumarchaeota archaeon]|nr:hypothetical protein [Nitrososphaerota archaeon]